MVRPPDQIVGPAVAEAQLAEHGGKARQVIAIDAQHALARPLEMAGQPIKNVQSYMAVMAGQRKGDSMAITVLRDGRKETIKVKLE